MADSIRSLHVVGLVLDGEGPDGFNPAAVRKAAAGSEHRGNYRYCSVEGELTLGLVDAILPDECG